MCKPMHAETFKPYLLHPQPLNLKLLNTKLITQKLEPGKESRDDLLQFGGNLGYTFGVSDLESRVQDLEL